MCQAGRCPQLPFGTAPESSRTVNDKPMTSADQPLYDIIFRGDILPGQQLAEVKERLARLFKADADKVNRLFSGAAVPLKRNLDLATAERYRAVLQQAGAQVQVAKAASVQTRSVPVRKAPALTLQQRLALQETERQRAEAERARLDAEQEEAPHFTLAPVGADLLEASEKSQPVAVEIDISNISLRPVGGNLVDPAEVPAVLPVVVPDVEFSLSAPGEELLQAHERRSLPPVALELPDLDLAPAGSDLGQLPGGPPPPPPDTSGFALVPDAELRPE